MGAPGSEKRAASKDRMLALMGRIGEIQIAAIGGPDFAT
jgi:hypothetical protein